MGVFSLLVTHVFTYTFCIAKSDKIGLETPLQIGFRTEALTFLSSTEHMYYYESRANEFCLLNISMCYQIFSGVHGKTSTKVM